MKMNMVQALNQAIAQEMEKDERVLIMGEDVGLDGGVFRVTEGLIHKFGEDRVIDTPLAESALVGAAVGMAAYGLRPLVEIQFMGFMYLAYNQIVAHVARLRNRTRSRYHLPLVIRMPYGGGVRALEHHSESTEAILCHIPGLKVVVPSTPYEAKGLFISSIRDEDPVIFLEPKKIYRAGRQEVPEEEYSLPLEEARLVREGKDLTIITWGAMVSVAEKAANMIEKEGIFPEVIDLRTLSPLDKKTVIQSVRRTGRALIVHEAPKTGGFGGEICSLINEEALLSLEAPVRRVTGFDIAVPLLKGEDYYYPNPERVLNNIKKLMEF